MPRLVWDVRALDDLENLADYIAVDSPRAVARVVRYIRSAAAALETFPEMGFVSEEAGAREYILTRYPYVLVYE
ncbi:MAG: type II toxin-antitoxin system RelE/ParE family toxin [Hyphomonadaceae bacterium]